MHLVDAYYASPIKEITNLLGFDDSLIESLHTEIDESVPEIAGSLCLKETHQDVLMAALIKPILKLPPSPLLRTELKVRLMKPKRWENISSITRVWKNIARARAQAWDLHTRLNPSAAEDFPSPFSASESMIQGITRCLRDPSTCEDEDWNAAYTCVDSTGKVQAVALVHIQKNFISLIATHPDNLSHPLNASITTRVRAAATEIIIKLASKTLSGKRGPVKLYAIRSAERRYRDLGFKVIRYHYNLSEMELTRGRIEKLMIDEKSPFHRFTT